ncbi:HD domain-containing phosphohydrolase [Deinococcus sp.]|uniref:bifunctional diguanylate cyclase/phosphohydrolase n=1 Tax=Deinococcus sp. TaxID=47478 RepID=UPI002869E1E7|nr:HD domain-containing phosphohydrolase [Deinococcus sp.]
MSRKIGYRSGERSALDSLGFLKYRLAEFSAAKELYTLALNLALELGEAQGELEARLHLAAVGLSLDNPAEAEAQVTRGLALATESESPTEEAEAHRILAELGRRQGDYRRAFDHTQEHLRIKDELFNTERDRQTRNLSIQFEVERARHDANVYRVRTEVEQEARLAAEQLVQERTAELAQAHQEIVTRLAMAAEYRDDTTGEHTRRVGRTAARIARAVGWPEDRARILGMAARLHDVGKIGIPDSILLKAGKLTVAEYEQMKSHTLIGSRILSGGRSDLLRMAEEIAMTHHERWDGTGYPLGLRGEEVPLTGRVVALADVFDALTQDRPYKRAWTAQEALAEIRGLSGTHFDPLLVEVALKVLTPGAGALPGDGPLDEEDASHLLDVFEQLQVERTRDVEEARLATDRTARELNRMAHTDALTGLPNRRAFEADLESAVQAPALGVRSPWVISCDLDGLKVVNDTLGYGQGDALLKRFGTALDHVFAPFGRAYRIGGDEFAVIGTHAYDDATLAALLAQALRASQVEGSPVPGASLGVARAPADAVTAGDLLRESDRRMYANKLRHRAGELAAP